MNVADLIQLLRAQPQDAMVVLDGCDCIDFAHHVEYEGVSDCLVIRREHGTDYMPSTHLADELADRRGEA